MYGDLETLKKLLGINDSSKDEILELYLNSATAFINREFGASHVFDAANATVETHIASGVDGLIDLPKLAVEIISVLGGEANNLSFSTHPQTPPYWGIELSSPAFGNVMIWYRPGITVETPNDIALAAMQIAAHWYKSRLADTADAVIIADGVTIQRSGIPLSAAQILSTYKELYGKVMQ